MKAIIYHRYGMPDVLKMVELEKPTPGPDEVLVKVYATSVNAADWRLLRGESFMERMLAGGPNSPKKKILGVDVAGRVEAVGSAVTQFRPGDEVYGDLSSSKAGGFAEYAAVPAKFLALKPKNLSFAGAAAIPLAAGTALQGLRDVAKLQPGQKLLITGATGGVGTFAVQIARAIGAEVTATSSPSKMDILKKLGADRVLDYTRENPITGGQRYDVILDIAAYRSFGDYRPILNPGGQYIQVGGGIGNIFRIMLFGPLASMRGGKKFGMMVQKPSAADLDILREMIESGQVLPVIDRCYPLDEVAEAMRYFGEKRVRGKVTIGVVAESA